MTIYRELLSRDEMPRQDASMCIKPYVCEVEPKGDENLSNIYVSNRITCTNANKKNTIKYVRAIRSVSVTTIIIIIIIIIDIITL